MLAKSIYIAWKQKTGCKKSDPRDVTIHVQIKDKEVTD